MDLKQLESRVTNLAQTLRTLADDQDFRELLAIIHKPGWTTPAEALLVNGLLESMSTQARHLAEVKQALIAGARAVSTK